MIKNFTTLVCLTALFITFSDSANSQQASDYFPSQTGFMWNYSITPLDSLNNEIDSLKIYRIDSFAVVTNYEGKLADIVPTKRGPLQTIHVQPFLDSLFYSFSGSDGYEYFNISSVGEFLLSLDSLGLDTTFSFLSFFQSLQDWYSVYRFAAGVNNEYTLLSVDTTFSNLPLRFEYLGKRLQDEAINTQIGNFNCKKFLITWKVSVLFPPPVPPVELLRTEDSVWIAQDNWVVLDIIPTNHIDLSLLGIPPFFVPGARTEILQGITGINDEKQIPNEFVLYQNFPNRFNPSTKIKFTIPYIWTQLAVPVQLKVYDVLGDEVATLVNKELSAGEYEVEFNGHSDEGQNLSTGIYFYQLKVGSKIQTKKMVFLK